MTINTLKHRLAALSRWHQDHGFPDPTKTPKIRQLLKGIRTIHPAPEKRAKPLELELLQRVSDWLMEAATAAQARGNAGEALRHTRNRALLLLGFWHGFRSDELVNLSIEFFEIDSGEGMTLFLPRSKTDRQLEGRRFACPALSRLCPVEAVETWLALSGLTQGPLFRKIDRWGHLSASGLTPSSIIPLLRQLLADGGIADAGEFSSHSLRRGFAQSAHLSGWDLRELMSYVVAERKVRCFQNYWKTMSAKIILCVSSMSLLSGWTSDASVLPAWTRKPRGDRPTTRQSCSSCTSTAISTGFSPAAAWSAKHSGIWSFSG